MNEACFTEDFRAEPYWWQHVPAATAGPAALPAEVDVAVIGAGYTGLAAALQTSRGGRSTLVLDAGLPGHGCSTRNGGQISTGIKPDLATLARRHGEPTARAIIAEGQRALAWIGEFVAAEGIDCDFRVAGRFHAAHSARQFRRLVRDSGQQPQGLEVPLHVVPRSEQSRELGSARYHGGVVYERHASLHPARLQQGLLQRVSEAGATVLGNCRVEAVQRRGRHFELRTARGPLRARDVVVASNGYTGAVTPWLRRRVIPIGSYVIATEALPPALMAELMPTDRVISDTRRVVYYYRPSPDRSRIVFGGRVTSGETSARRSAMLLRRELVALFPQLRAVRISHSWMGFVAYTFDSLAHVGCHDGVHHALGYCGSGVAMAPYLGTRIGQQLLGDPDGRTALGDIRFPTRPLYRGRPWFLPLAVAGYRLLDRLR